MSQTNQYNNLIVKLRMMHTNTPKDWDAQIFQEQESQNLSMLHYMQGLNKCQAQRYERKQVLMKDQPSIMIQEQYQHREVPNQIDVQVQYNLNKQIGVGTGNKSGYYQNTDLKKQYKNRSLSYQYVLNFNKSELSIGLQASSIKKTDGNQNETLFQKGNRKSEYFNFKKQKQKTKTKTKKRNKSEFWNQKQVVKFNLFLLLVYQCIYQNKIQKIVFNRVKWNFFKDMSQFVGTKNNIQCRTRFNRKIKEKYKFYTLQAYLYKGLIKFLIDNGKDPSKVYIYLVEQIQHHFPNQEFAFKFEQNLSKISQSVYKIINHVNHTPKKLDCTSSTIQQSNCSDELFSIKNHTNMKNPKYNVKSNKIKQVTKNKQLTTPKSPCQGKQFAEQYVQKKRIRKPAEFWKKDQASRFDLFLLLQYQDIYEVPIEYDININEKSNKNERTKWCFFKNMGAFIGNKTNTQCRSRFYRKIKQKSSIPTIQAYLYDKFSIAHEKFHFIVEKVQKLILQAISRCQDKQKFVNRLPFIQLNLRKIKNTIEDWTQHNSNKKIQRIKDFKYNTQFEKKVLDQYNNHQQYFQNKTNDTKNKNISYEKIVVENNLSSEKNHQYVMGS